MTDIFSPAKRRQIMSAVKSKNTKPELLVRSTIHRLGYRYRIHVKGLPGRPDLFFSKRKKAIQVHGCFWHGHAGCSRAKLPTTNASFWREKISTNVSRDEKNNRAARELGMEYLVIWECETRDLSALRKRLKEFLGKPRLA